MFINCYNLYNVYNKYWLVYRSYLTSMYLIWDCNVWMSMHEYFHVIVNCISYFTSCNQQFFFLSREGNMIGSFLKSLKIAIIISIPEIFCNYFSTKKFYANNNKLFLWQFLATWETACNTINMKYNLVICRMMVKEPIKIIIEMVLKLLSEIVIIWGNRKGMIGIW